MQIAMISQPMNGKTSEEIVAKKAKMAEYLTERGYRVVNTYFEEEWAQDAQNQSLWFLAKALEVMSKCDAVYFADGWENARGCRIEHEAAKAYGLDVIYEDI